VAALPHIWNYHLVRRVADHRPAHHVLAVRSVHGTGRFAMFVARLRADHKVSGALIADNEVCAAVALALALRLFLRPVVWYRRQAGKQCGFADNEDGQQQAEKNLCDQRIGFGLF
jgi:hypothetical protein